MGFIFFTYHCNHNTFLNNTYHPWHHIHEMPFSERHDTLGIVATVTYHFLHKQLPDNAWQTSIYNFHQEQLIHFSWWIYLYQGQYYYFAQNKLKDWYNIECNKWLNSLWPGANIWQHRSGSALVRVTACCLTSPSHYLNQNLRYNYHISY